MKVVLLHDWLTGYRGGERVLDAIAEMFPEAPLYTLIHKKDSTSPFIENRKIVTSFLNHIPGIEENYRKFLPLFPLAASSLRITEEADLIISSSHCVIKGVTKPEGSKHLCYIHSPMRYIYDQFDSYFGPGTSLPIRVAAHVVRPYLQTWDYTTNTNVDHFVANADFVSERVNFFYGREASVVHPFVDLKDFRHLQSVPARKKNYYLMVTAFAPNKRVDLAIKAMNELGFNLKIVGSGQQAEELRNLAGPTIEFMGNLTREEIVGLMREAQAFIFPGVEDFGITPLESLAAGTPVIAFEFGGVLETLNPKVAKFFSEPTVSSLKKAIQEFDPSRYEKHELFSRAEFFSRENFQKNLQNEINKFHFSSQK
ncbi:MAG: glycosyltransferase [Bacteriovoracaceae bacterium]